MRSINSLRSFYFTNERTLFFPTDLKPLRVDSNGRSSLPSDAGGKLLRGGGGQPLQGLPGAGVGLGPDGPGAAGELAGVELGEIEAGRLHLGRAPGPQEHDGHAHGGQPRVIHALELQRVKRGEGLQRGGAHGGQEPPDGAAQPLEIGGGALGGEGRSTRHQGFEGARGGPLVQQGPFGRRPFRRLGEVRELFEALGVLPRRDEARAPASDLDPGVGGPHGPHGRQKGHGPQDALREGFRGGRGLGRGGGGGRLGHPVGQGRFGRGRGPFRPVRVDFGREPLVHVRQVVVAGLPGEEGRSHARVRPGVDARRPLLGVAVRGGVEEPREGIPLVQVRHSSPFSAERGAVKSLG